MSYTIEELRYACSFALSVPTMNALTINGVELPRIHEMAIKKAFMLELKGKYIDLLREAMKDLDKGQYRPSGEWPEIEK